MMAEQMGGTAGQIVSPQPYDRAPYQLSAGVNQFETMLRQRDAMNRADAEEYSRRSWLGKLFGGPAIKPRSYGAIE